MGVRFFPVRTPLLPSPTTSVVLIAFSGEYTLLLYSRVLKRYQSLYTLTMLAPPFTTYRTLRCPYISYPLSSPPSVLHYLPHFDKICFLS